MGSGEQPELDLLSGFDPSSILYAVVALLFSLWLQTLVWSGAALVLIKHEGKVQVNRDSAKDVATPGSGDLRALREARQNSVD